MPAPPPREKETYEGMTLACVICRHVFTSGTPYKSVSRKTSDGSLVSDAYHPACFAVEEESMQKRAADELARSSGPRLTRRFDVHTTFVIEDTEASGNYDGDVEEILRWNLVAMMNSLSGHFAAKKDANAKVSFENADVRLSTFPSRRATEPVKAEPVRTSTETAYDEAGEWAGEVPTTNSVRVEHGIAPLDERPAILNTPDAVRALEERVTAVELSVSGLLSLSRRQNPQRY